MSCWLDWDITFSIGLDFQFLEARFHVITITRKSSLFRNARVKVELG